MSKDTEQFDNREIEQCEIANNELSKVTGGSGKSDSTFAVGDRVSVWKGNKKLTGVISSQANPPGHNKNVKYYRVKFDKDSAVYSENQLSHA